MTTLCGVHVRAVILHIDRARVATHSARPVRPMPKKTNEAGLLLNALVASSDDAIISTDPSGTITSWNPAAERIFGYSEGEAVGRSIRTMVPPELQAEEDELMKAIGEGQTIEHYETVRVRKDGHRVDVSFSASPVRSTAGRIIGELHIARDLSGIQRNRRDALWLAAIVDSSDDAIVSKDLDRIVTSWNRAAEAMFGYSASEMVGQSIRKIIPDERQAEEDEVLARIRHGDRVDHYETVRRRKDGTVIPISLTVSPLRSPNGTVIGASTIARDITERKRAEEERQHLLRIARESSRLKDEFLATLSHELRTPLNAIVGYVGMLRAGLLTGEKQSRALDTVSRNLTSLTQIVEDVLDVSRIVSGKVRLDVQSVELPAVIETAVRTMRPTADAKGVRLDRVVDPRTPAVSGDPERLQQILWNLLSNAVKFTNRGGHVQVRLERVRSHVEITVGDTGIGMPADFLPHVFERFRQADAGISRAHGGLGLGLAITRHLVELHGGRISVASEGPGRGSTFRIELPVRSILVGGPLQEPQDAEPPDVSGSITVPQLRGVRILAVDDDRDTLALIREILETTGATVVTADSGEQALESLSRNRPDVLLTDLAMPQMNGYQLIDRVRRSEQPEIRRIPAVAFTAYARSEDRTKALRSGFHMHLAKPIDSGELMAAMAALAKRSDDGE